MKKIFFMLLIVFSVLMYLAGCNVDFYEETYTVTFDSKGGSSVESVEVKKGNYIPKPVDPEKEGYYFVGWYLGEEEWNFIGYVVADDITLKAKWEILGSKGLWIEGTTLIGIGECEDKDITIPRYITDIEDFAFKNCSNIKSIKVEAGSQLTRIGEYAFAGCNSLSNIVIPDSVTSIEDSAFRGCSSLTSVVIPDSVTSIGSGAFYGCNTLEKISLPFVGASLNENSVPGSGLLGYIFGASYYSNNGYHVPTSLKEVVITGGIDIGHYAFYGCNNITSIEIPISVTSIEDEAFRNCSSLANIIIPSSVTSVGFAAFLECNSLKNVYYNGTIEEWDNIKIGSYNSKFTAATIYYYSETKPTTSGNYWHYDSEGNVVVW